MDFEAYLISKKIDSAAFKTGDPGLWSSWDAEFVQVHPNSFTAQKLYLINPVRRKYPLKQVPVVKESPEKTSPLNSTPAVNAPISQDSGSSASIAKPAVPRPVFKPKPKMT